MNAHPPGEFSLTVTREASALTVRLAGELDYDTGDELVATVVAHLGGRPHPREVRLDFGGLTWIDSSGLAALLMAHRHISAAGADLHLDHRPDFLDRRLRRTDILGHLTEPAARPWQN
ncbi:STAS domain-containing protein [Streptomyces sp. NPDC047017]|uniref:STAS domain-containing protein n=1 Tax=Streptomyces sp. NPDC047017 TaxID=3155024 RepID=UPI0033FB8A4E